MGTRSTLTAPVVALFGALSFPLAVSAAVPSAGAFETGRLPSLAGAPAQHLAAKAKKKPKTPKPTQSAAPAEASDPLAAPAAAPVDPNEPELPSRLPTAIHCPADDVDPGKDVVIRCAVRPPLKPTEVSLFYRSAGKELFDSLPMTKSPRGWYTATVPASAVTGRTVQFYVEASKGVGNTAATTGDSGSPNIIVVRKEAGVTRTGDEPDLQKDESPLKQQQEAAAAAAAEAAKKWRLPKTYWVGLGIGAGYGWHGERNLDRTDTLQVAAGFSAASVFHLLPEVGYQWDERYAFSLEARVQHIPDEGPGDGNEGPPRWSTTVLARAYRSFDEGALQYFASGSLGAGQGFRLVVPPNDSNLLRTDTVRGGPVVLGPGVGVMFYGLKRLAGIAEARVLVGLPDFAAVGELNVRVQYGF